MAASCEWEEEAVAFVTDVEGNLDYFKAFVRQSVLITYTDAEERTIDFLSTSSQSQFVFGGDVCDKGYGSLEVTRQLVDFKERYPERVVLILGNRDLNKLRFTSELDPEEIATIPIREIPGPYWVSPQQRVSPYQYLVKLILTNEDISQESQIPDSTLAHYNTVANRLRWMLDCTMGSQGDFERRRKELGDGSSDDDVVESFLSSVQPGGIMRRFLVLGQLAYIWGDCLFIHGGVTDANFGYVPGMKEKVENPREWVASLNDWLRKELLGWVEEPKWRPSRRYEARDEDGNGDWSARGGNRVIAYVAPGSEPTVIYERMFNNRNNFKECDASTARSLVTNGIKRIVVGHTPHGHSPTIMRSSMVDVIAADTSYSDMKAGDNRGAAVSEVVIGKEYTNVHGRLPDGSKIRYRLHSQKGKGDPFVGRMVNFPDGAKGWFVKAKLADEDAYVISQVDGFKVQYAKLSTVELRLLVEQLPHTTPHEDDSVSIDIDYPGGKTTLRGCINDVEISQVLELPAFRRWLDSLSPELKVEKMQISSVDRFGPTLGFAKCNARVLDKRTGRSIPGITFVRGPSVTVLPVFVDSETQQEYIIALIQPRFPTGQLDFVEAPAGMINLSTENAMNAALRVLEEKVGVDVGVEDVVDMGKTFFGEETPIFLSPGGSDEDMEFYLYKTIVTPCQLLAMKTDLGKNDNLTFGPLLDIMHRSTDAKTWVAFGLYQQLKGSVGRTTSSSPTSSASNVALK